MKWFNEYFCTGCRSLVGRSYLATIDPPDGVLGANPRWRHLKSSSFKNLQMIWLMKYFPLRMKIAATTQVRRMNMISLKVTLTCYQQVRRNVMAPVMLNLCKLDWLGGNFCNLTKVTGQRIMGPGGRKGWLAKLMSPIYFIIAVPFSAMSWFVLLYLQCCCWPKMST